MTYLNTTRVETETLSGRLAALIADFRMHAKRRRIFTRTLRELGSLSDRDLADLGIHRSSIRDVAREAAYAR